MSTSTLKEVSHIAKYDGKNFSLWKLGLWVLLEQHELIKIVTGDKKIPEEVTVDGLPQNHEEIAVWKHKDCLARGYILSTVELSQQRILIDCTNANQMWTALSAQHLEQANDNQYDLQARFYEYHYQPGQDMKTHIAEIKSIAHHLGEVGRPVDERELITKIICTLPAAYRPFVSSWRHSPMERQNLTTLTSLLLQEEREISKWESKGTGNQETALHAQSSSSSSNKGGHTGYRDSQVGSQHFSHRGSSSQLSTSTHFGSDNSNRGATRRGGRGRNRFNYGRNSQERKSSTEDNHQKRKCEYCYMDNHVTEDCNTKRRHERVEKEKIELSKRRKKDDGLMTVDVPIQDQDFSLMSVAPRFNIRSTGDWFADSGATQHMTDQRQSLFNFISVPAGSWSVRGIGSSSYPVQGYGDVHVWTIVNGEKKSATIKEVLYVPGLGTNLFSIAVVTDLGWTVTFTGTQVFFTSKQDDLAMSGERVGRTLYLLAIRARDQYDDQESFAFPTSLSPGLSTWHRRLAHVNYKTILKMKSSGVVKGLDLASTVIPLEPCVGCAHGKHQRSSFPTGRTRATHTGQLIHSDLCGPMERATPNGSLYFVLFIDDYSGWRFIYFLKAKSEAADRFMELIHTIRGATGNLVCTLRTDNGGEWSSTAFATWLNRKGIRHETSAPYTPQQDGVSERGIRTVTEGTRSCIHDYQLTSEPWGEKITNGVVSLVKESRLPLYLWAEAASFTVYTLNRVLSKVSPITPYEAWHNKLPDLSHLRVFGSIAFVHIPKEERKKLDEKSIRCIFVGYSQTQKAYRFWEPKSRTIKISRDVTFDEHHRLADVPGEPQAHNPFGVSPLPALESSRPTGNDTTERVIHEESPALVQAEPPTQQEEKETEKEQLPQARRSLRGRIPVREWKACTTQPDSEESYVPKSYTDAINCPDAKKWKIAMQEEYQALMQNETWSIVPCPPQREPIKSRWVFDIKPAMNGEPPRYKARFVAKGFSQRPGIDFNETYASVVTHDTMRIVMATVAAEDLEMSQMDVKSAFLNGDLKEELYMLQPEGFVVGQKNEVCRLHKSIYGLKQASHVWGEHFTNFIKEHRFNPSESDPCFFTRNKEGERTLLIIWVDDGIIASNKQNAIDDFLFVLGEKFQIRSHPVSRFVGVIITRNRQQRKIFLSQPDYIDKILRNFHMASCSPKIIPADPNAQLTRPTTTSEQNGLKITFPYREAVGSLLYLALVTRPDISYAVGQVSRFVESYDQSHCNAVRRIFAYLRGTPNYGICFDGLSQGSLVGYTDADYAGCIDSRRSTTGSVFLFHSGPIAWCSRRQSCVAQSTTESEYIAASETAKEAIWIQRVLPDFQPQWNGPITILCDNQGAIQLTRHPDQRQKTKHIDVRYHFIRQKQKEGEINIQYIESVNQLADIFTKALPGPRFTFIRDALGILPVPNSIL